MAMKKISTTPKKVAAARNPASAKSTPKGGALAASAHTSKAKPAVPVAPVSSTPIDPKFEKVREALIRLRERLTGQIDFLATDNLNRKPDDAEVDFRSEEQGTDNFDRDFALNRVSLDQDTIFEIDEALSRMEQGAYGHCESCGGAIEKARLAALPYVRNCIGCQSKFEKGRKPYRPFDSNAPLFPTVEKTTGEVVQEEE